MTVLGSSPYPPRAMKHRWLSWLAALGTGVALAAQPQMLNGLMVIVDQDVITYKDVMSLVGPTMEVLYKTYADQPEVLRQKIEQAKQDGIEQLVERKLILHEFDHAGFKLPESLVDDRVKKTIQEKFGGDRAALTKTLQSKGTTYEAYRRDIREDFIIGAMRLKNLGYIGSEIVISPHKIEKYYAEHLDEFKIKDQVKLRAIMINGKPKRSDESARELAQEIETKLDEGASFSLMASVYSEDTYRSRGGDRGSVERTDLRPELAQAAFGLKPGQRSGIIAVGDTFWILLVEDVKSNYIKTLPEVRSAIEGTLQAQEQSRLQKEWIDQLKKKSFINYF